MVPKPPNESTTAIRGSSSSARRRARELAVQGLYQWLVGGQDVAAIEGHLAETRGRDGLGEGAVMVSTPGNGLEFLNL